MHYTHVSKPSRVEVFRVQYRASGLCVVTDGGGRQILLTRDREEAEKRALDESAAARERAKIKVRPCMCCHTPFQSDGVHNRLCNHCRRAPADPMGDAQRPYLSRKANG